MSLLIKIFKSPYFWLGVILIISFTVRLYKIDSAVADWHAWRQADTAAVARNFYKEGFNPFIPKYDDMSPPGNIKANPNRYRFVEFPIYNSLVYFAYILNGGINIALARLVSVLLSLGSIVFIYLIVRRYWGNFTALISSLIFGILPFNIYFSRAVLPEPALVFFSLGMFYFTDRWIWEDKLRLFVLSILFTASAFLIKPMAIFYLLPLVCSYWQKEKKIWPISKRYLFWIIPSFLPFAIWRWWMGNFPEGIPASAWLFNGNGIRFRPAFFRWIVDDRLGREILTVPGVVLFVIGVLKGGNKGIILRLLLLSSFLYLIVFATGNVQHDYYQVLIIPVLSIFLARGVVLLIGGVQGFISRLWSIPITLFMLALTFYLGWYVVKGFYQINNNSIVIAGEEADRVLPKNAVVVAPWGGDTSFLYQVNRPGFSIMMLPIEELVQKYGVTHFVSVNYDNDTNDIIKRYRIIEKDPRYVIVDVKTQITPSLNDNQ